MEAWAFAAREAVRDSMAQYTHAGDRFPLVGLADAFCEDGVLEPEPDEPVRGRAAIEEYRARMRRESGGTQAGRLLRHNVTNVWFEEVRPDEARVTSYYTVFTETGLDHMGRYRDRFVPVGDRWLIAYRLATMDWRSGQSKFGRRQ